MKTLTTLILLLSGALSHAQYLAPFDRLCKDNVTVRVQSQAGDLQGSRKRTSDGYSYSKDFEKTFGIEVSPISEGSPTVLEFYLACEGQDLKPWARRIAQIPMEVGSGKYEVTCTGKSARVPRGYIKGWFVRVMRDNRVIGFAASSPKYEQLAMDPGVLVLWATPKAEWIRR